MAKFADSVIKRYNMDVIFIPQVTAEAHNMDDDREVSKRIINKMQSKDRVWFIKDKLTHHEIKALYSNLAFIVGTRFHSVIFSLTAYVPALAIEYEHKTRGIMSDLNLSEWVVKIEDVRADVLSQRFGELVKRRSEYIKTLKKNLPPYIDEARKTISHVVRAYNMAQKTEN